ncbi:hypothetical protein F5Y07DRAFT_410470 [Xylaria sp. FL0933]|nr:hypothetical protein F5Y07DRAFT_410470 [Xylaria sp. FL0933]
MADGRERNPQSSSIFFLLPTELRIEVYRRLFSATRLTFGEWIRPKANSLALLRACRRIEAEIDDMWIGHVLFNFCSYKSIYDKLISLSIHITSKIRHIRVVDQRHPYSTWPAKANHLPVVLQQIPGLKLDRLTILGGDDHKSDRNWIFVRCASLDYLISLGSGWKELHYISRSGDMLASAPFAYGEYGGFLLGNNANVDESSNEESNDEESNDEGSNNEGSNHEESDDEESNVDNLRLPILLPSHWQRVLETRDSALSGPSVVIYQYNEWMDEDGLEKETLVIAKRGTGVDYISHAQNCHQIPITFGAKWWDDIRVREDVYTHAYEYDWSHFDRPDYFPPLDP